MKTYPFDLVLKDVSAVTHRQWPGGGEREDSRPADQGPRRPLASGECRQNRGPVLFATQYVLGRLLALGQLSPRKRWAHPNTSGASPQRQQGQPRLHRLAGTAG